MDFNLTSELQDYLDKNEKLLWTGQPRKGIVFSAADIFMIPFSRFNKNDSILLELS